MYLRKPRVLQRGDDSDLASYLRIEERELEAGGRELNPADLAYPELSRGQDFSVQRTA